MSVSNYISKTIHAFTGVSGIELVLNILMHVLILFSILSMIFWSVIADMSTKSLTYEATHAIDSGFNTMLRTISPQQQVELSAFVNAGMPTLVALDAMYSQPSQALVINNNWVKYMNIAIVIGLIVVILAVFFSLWLTVGVKTPLRQIAWENLWVFFFIGMTELIFFYAIAIKFVPVLPSAITRDAISVLQGQ